MDGKLKSGMNKFEYYAPKQGKYVPELVGENGLPVVKKLADELIDGLGPKILKEYFRN